MKNQYEIDYQQGYDKANEEWSERIDKIRAEIEGCEDRVRSNEDYDKAEYVAYTDAITDALVILDKYKAETEDTDGTNK